MSKLEEVKQAMHWSDEELDDFIEELRMRLNYENSEKDTTATTETLVTDFLTQMGVPKNSKGYEYLKCAIQYVLKKPKALDAVTKDIYPHVATECSTTPTRVERAIRYVVIVTSERNSFGGELYDKVFGASINPFTEKPTNSEFIAASVDYLNHHWISK